MDRGRYCCWLSDWAITRLEAMSQMYGGLGGIPDILMFVVLDDPKSIVALGFWKDGDDL